MNSQILSRGSTNLPAPSFHNPLINKPRLRRSSSHHRSYAQKQDKPVDIDLFETKDAAPSPSSPTFASSFLSSLDFSEPMSFDGEEKTEYDPLRDGPLRYLGYANELGEAFAAWLFPGGVPLSYAVAIGYVLFDTVDKYNKTKTDAQEKLSSRDLPSSVNLQKLVDTIGAERGIDTLIWQLIASVAAPGYTIHTVVALVTRILDAIEAQDGVKQSLSSLATSVSSSVDPELFIATLNKSLPTAAGLLAIPFIVHPIDGAVHALLNATLRPALRRYICNEAGGAEAGLAVCSSCCPKDPPPK